MDIAVVLDAVLGEFQLIDGGAVIEVELLILPADAIGGDTGLVEGDLTGLVQTDVIGLGGLGHLRLGGSGGGIIVIAVGLEIQDLAVSGINIILELVAACGEFQFEDRLSVVKIELAVIPYGIFGLYIGVGQSDLLSLLQRDIGRRGIGLGVALIVVIIVNVHHGGLQCQTQDLLTNILAQKLQKILIRKGGAGFQLQHDVAGSTIGIIDEVAGLIDVIHQLAQHRGAVLADVIGIGVGYGFAVLVAAFHRGHKTIGIIGDADLGVDTQRQAAMTVRSGGGAVGGRAAAGQKDSEQHCQGRDQRRESNSSFHSDFPFYSCL